MKSNILWIFFLNSISSYIDATSNDTTTAAVKFIYHPLTSPEGEISSSTSVINSDDSLKRENISETNMSPSFVATQVNGFSESIRYNLLKHNKYLPTSTLLAASFNQSKAIDASKTKRSADAAAMLPECEVFEIGDNKTRTFYSPGYPKEYTKNITCVRVLEAPPGYLIKLDFRDFFQIEPSEDCRFDMLEVRDGAHGFANILGQLCGHSFPDIITSKDRFLWLRFTSDENIEEKGFKAVYEFIPRPTSVIVDETDCTIYKEGFEGWINSTEINDAFPQKVDNIMKLNLPLDCMFIVTVEKGWKILLSFVEFALKKPNECSVNFIDVFPEKTDIRNRLKNFCGSIADTVPSTTNILHVRYFAEASAINSTFAILFTAMRDKTGPDCAEDEFDCDDQNCIKAELKCNGVANCRFKNDEPDKCPNGHKDESDNIKIVIIVFGVIMTVLAIAFLVNCTRKIIRDHKIIREHIRQSRESKLDELGRHSTKLTKSRENIALAQLTKIPPPSFDLDSPTSINSPYYRDMLPPKNGARIIDSKNDLNMRIPEDEQKDEMCDSREMACQTRESLFQPVFKNKVTQSPLPSGLRFSTFGYLDTSATTPSPPPPPLSSTIHHHPQFVSSATMACPTHSQSNIKNHHTLPHQHHQHSHSHHQHSHRGMLQHSGSANQSSNEGNDKGTNTMDNDTVQRKLPLRKDDSQTRSYSDVRKSAPDVIIIGGCTSSH